MKLQLNLPTLAWELPLFLVVLVALLLTGSLVLLIWAIVFSWFVAGDIKLVPKGAPKSKEKEE